MGDSLFHINQQIDELTDRLVDPETGELDEEVLEQLGQLDVAKDEKLEAYGMKIKSLVAEVKAIKDAKEGFTKREHAKVALIDKLQRVVDSELRGEPREYTNVKYSYRKSESVQIVNEELVPAEYCDYETKKKPVKARIKAAIKDKQEVPGAVLVENKNLQVL